MNLCCPHCLVDLRHQRVRRIPASAKSKQHYLCPACDGVLMLNPHPAEKLFFPSVLIAIFALNIYSGWSGIKLSIEGAAIMLVLIFAAAWAVRHALPAREWPRYRIGSADRSR